MTDERGPSIHATAVRVGESAILIRGPSGSGKSRLAFDLILAGRAGVIPATHLIGDDRVLLTARAGVLLVGPVPELAGLIEIRGLGIRRCDDDAADVPVHLVVDLAAEDAARLPAPEALRIELEGVELERLPVGSGYQPFPLVAAHLITIPGYEPTFSPHLPKAIP